MNSIPKSLRPLALASIGAATLILAACGPTAVKPDGADRVRAELTALQTNPEYASRAPVALQEAEDAVRAAETPTTSTTSGAELVYVAERKVAIARAQAEKRIAEDKMKALSDQRDAIRLDARTAEANAARSQADQAIAIAQAQQQAAASARTEAEIAKAAAMAAEAQAAELKRQMEELQAKQTDRGLVMTLGDVLFATGKADLKAGAMDRLGKLVTFLGKYSDRTVIIEGHTDSVGSDEMNMALSQRRADAVRAYLLAQGVAANRVTAVGKGESLPVADNGSAAGRQQNRRVEVVISNTAQ